MASIKYDPIVGGVVPVEPGGIQQPEQAVPVSPVDKMKELLRNVKSQQQAPPQQPVSEPIQYTRKSMEPPLALSMANKIPFVNLFTDPIVDRYTQKKLAKEQQYKAIFDWADTINSPEEAKKFARIPAVQAAFISKLPGVEDAQDIEDLLTMKLDPYAGKVKMSDIYRSAMTKGAPGISTTPTSKDAFPIPTTSGKNIYIDKPNMRLGDVLQGETGNSLFSGFNPNTPLTKEVVELAKARAKFNEGTKPKWKMYRQNDNLSYIVDEKTGNRIPVNTPDELKNSKYRSVQGNELIEDLYDKDGNIIAKKGSTVLFMYDEEDPSDYKVIIPSVEDEEGNIITTKKTITPNIMTFLTEGGNVGVSGKSGNVDTEKITNSILKAFEDAGVQ